MPTPSPKALPSQPACIIHCRVSSAKQAHEGESLSVQTAICRDIAAKQGWSIAHEPWEESFSGRKTRPVFNEILTFLDKRPGEIRYYLFRSIDRFTRGGSLAYEQMKRELALRGVEMVDTLGIIQPVKNTLEDVGFEYDWSKSSPSEVAEVVAAVTAKQEVTTILTRLIGQEIRLTQRGYKIRGPQDGYQNAKIYVENRRCTIQVPDPERAKYFVAMFEMRASGQFTDAEICDRINAMGFRTKPRKRWDASHARVIGQGGGRALVPKHFQEIVQRPIYCGVVCEKWTRWQPIRAPYPGLIPISLFNAANRGKVFLKEGANGELSILYDYHPERLIRRISRDNPLFPYRHVVVCPTCRKPMLGSSPRGSAGTRYPTYHCARGHKYLGIRKALFDSTTEAYVAKLQIRPTAVGLVQDAVIDKYNTREGDIIAASKAVQRTVADLEVQKAEALRAFKLATTDLLRQSFEAEATALQEKIDSYGAVKAEMTVDGREVEDFLLDARTIIEHPSILLENPASAQEQQALYSLVFHSLPTFEELRDGTPQLRWIYCLFSDAADMKSGLVRPNGFQWNVIEEEILHWKKMLLLAPSLRSRLDGARTQGSIPPSTSPKS